MLDSSIVFIKDCYCKLFCMPRTTNNANSTGPARYWMGTIPHADFNSSMPLPGGVAYIKGQQEIGTETGFNHWQLLVVLSKPQRLSWLKNKFGPTAHWEQTRSAASEQYVWKEDTRVPNTQFEIGQKPIRRNNHADWEKIWDLAKNGRIDEIPAQIRTTNYRTLKQVKFIYDK